MRKNKNLKLLILGILFFQIALFYALPSVGSAQTTTPPANTPPTTTTTPATTSTTAAAPTVAKGGPEDTIREILCTPTDYTPNESLLGGAATNPAKNDLYICINKAYRFAIVFSAFVGVLYTAIAGYMYMSGAPAAIKTAKEMIIGVITGLIILFISYIFLRQINPDLVKFKTIQPPEIAQVGELCPPANIVQAADGSFTCGAGGPPVTKDGKSTTPSGGGGDGSKPAGHQASELAGCTFQGGKASQVPNMTEALFQDVKSICAAASAGGNKPAISSITSGTHAANSFHYKGCATDFAGGDAQYTLHATGMAVIAAAKSLGMRINPGSDANQTFHVHVDIGSACTAPVIPASQRGS